MLGVKAAGVTRRSLIAAALLVAVSGASWLALDALGIPAGGRLTVVVTDGDGSRHELPLDRDGRLEVASSLGVNVIVVESGMVRMHEANCPGQDCIDSGGIDRPGRSIVCLPNELVVIIEDQDGQNGGSGQGGGAGQSGSNGQGGGSGQGDGEGQGGDSDSLPGVPDDGRRDDVDAVTG
jgi:hypothetical protein